MLKDRTGRKLYVYVVVFVICVQVFLSIARRTGIQQHFDVFDRRRRPLLLVGILGHVAFNAFHFLFSFFHQGSAIVGHNSVDNAKFSDHFKQSIVVGIVLQRTVIKIEMVQCVVERNWDVDGCSIN